MITIRRDNVKKMKMLGEEIMGKALCHANSVTKGINVRDFKTGMRKRWILLCRFRSRVSASASPLPRQDVFISLSAIPPTIEEAAVPADRFCFRFCIPALRLISLIIDPLKDRACVFSQLPSCLKE